MTTKKSLREIKQSPFTMGKDEIFAPPVKVPASWGSAPTNPVAFLFNDQGQNITATNMDPNTGAGTVVGDTITLPKIFGLTVGKRYRVEIQWLDSGNTLEAYGFIDCEE